MRKILWAITIVLLAGSCSKPANINVQRMSDTTTNEGCVMDIQFAKFTSENTKLQEDCNQINDSIAVRIDSLKSYMMVQATEYIQVMKKLGYQPVGPLELVVRDSVYMATKNLISVRMMIYTFTGGAHGSVSYYAFNYDVQNGEMLSLGQIINSQRSELVDEQLRLNMKNPDECFNVDPTLADVSTINMTETDFVFTFSPYTLGPWVCGTGEIAVPRSSISEAVLLKK